MHRWEHKPGPGALFPTGTLGSPILKWTREMLHLVVVKHKSNLGGLILHL